MVSCCRCRRRGVHRLRRNVLVGLIGGRTVGDAIAKREE